ncbi:MAG: T9SS type A sorting domain-containing protein [Flavobacteriales bacterium]|jgi:hypothetical protein
MTYKLLALVAATVITLSSHAQLPANSPATDFTVTDQFGVQHNLFSYLNQDYTVFLQISASWSGPDWGYHTSGAMEDLYFNHGPAGAAGVSASTTNDIMVIFIEGDGATTDDEMAGGAGSQGNWYGPGTSGITIDFPMANPGNTQTNQINADYAIAYFPTIYRICPNRIVTEVGQLDAIGLYATVDACPAPAYLNTDPAILSYTGDLATCGPVNVSVILQNNGILPLTSCTFTASGGTVPINYTWNGFLDTYETTSVNIGTVTMTNSGNINVAVTSVDQNNSNSNVAAAVSFADDGTTHFVIDILFDRWPEECSWEISDENGGIVAGADYSVNIPTDNSTITEHIWLPSTGCYTFNAYDAYGDGFFDSQYGNFADGSIAVRTLSSNGSVFSSVLSYSGDYNYASIEAKSNVILEINSSSGCTNAQACNYNPSATTNDGSCIFPGTSCNDNNPNTVFDQLNENCVCVGFNIQTDCADEIFISEYVEGTANNKAIELYNPSSEPIVLTGVYSMGRDRDGSGVPMLMDITGVIQPHDVRVFALDKRDPNATGTELAISPLLEAVADTFLNPVYVQFNSPMYYNGDDAFVLVKNGNQIIDIVGEIGFDPGSGWWDPNDPNQLWWTVDNSMVRKPEILQGVTVNPTSFDPSLEWDTLSVDDFSHLGWHETICASSQAGCTNLTACNYNPAASVDNGSCLYIGNPCNDGNPTTANDFIQTDCTCLGTLISTNCSASDYNFGNVSYGIYPTENTALIDGCIGEPYYQPFYILVPTNANAVDPSFPDSPVENMTINSLTIGGNPLGDYGLSYACLNDDCVFQAGNQYCLNLFGNPNQAGSFEVELNISLTINFLGLPVESPTTFPYTLTISADCGPEISGCTNASACNFNPAASINDGSCLVIGSACNDLNPSTINDVILTNCQCAGTPIDPGCSGFSVSNNTSNPTCAGLSNGFISVNTSGTSAPFSYSWNTGATGSSINNLSAGSYSVTISDALGCAETLNFNIAAPTPLSATTTSNAAICFGGASGSASVIVSGGTAPYSYAWNTSPIQNTAQISNVTAGIYSVNITDANGCAFSSSTTIAQPAQPLVVSATAIAASCSQSDGSASTVVNGNTGTVQYLWSNGQTGATATNLSAGAYTVTINSGGCSAQTTVNVNNINAPVINHVSNSPQCFGQNTGSINTVITGGTQPYQYLWSNGGGGTSQSGLNAGSYTFIVIDNAGCQASIVVSLTQPNPLNISLAATPTSCSGAPQGSVNATVSGGTQPYQFSWNDGSGGASINSLTAGSYSLTITDAYGCQASAVAQVINPDGVAAYTNTSGVSCFGGSDGEIEIVITDGTPPYSFEWNNGATGTAVISNLLAGDYSCIITDANGCSFTASATIDGPQGNLPDILGQTNVTPFSTETYSTAFQEGYSYVWTATGGNVLVGPSSNFIDVQWGATGSGVVTLTELGPDGCEIVNSLVVNIGTSGLIESTQPAFRVYPIPFTDRFTITTTDYQNAVPFSVFDATGTMALNGTLSGKSTTIDTETLSAGIYLLQTNNQTIIITKIQ